MKTIYKYPFTDLNTVLYIPEDAKLLKFAYQDGVLCAWFMVDPKTAHIIRPKYYFIAGTGHEIPNHLEDSYIDTVFDPDGFVWHIFTYE